MIKRKIIETIREYDENGKLTRETVTETTEDDNSLYCPVQPYFPAPLFPLVANGMEFTCKTEFSCTEEATA
ncbi:MAG: hypothetical protein H6Q60_1400 [Oscillospiraceae bacterium]|nr:hypothetical protein [Oscillospiraceae bacterium]